MHEGGEGVILDAKTIVVVGCGEIGTPIYRLSLSAFEQVIPVDIKLGVPAEPRFPVAALHVAIPGSLSDFTPTVIHNFKSTSPKSCLCTPRRNRAERTSSSRGWERTASSTRRCMENTAAAT